MNEPFQDNLTQHVQQMGANWHRVPEVMATAVVDLFQRRYDKFDSERANKLGGKRTHFWGQVSKSVHYANLTPEGFDVDVTHLGVRLQWLGGTIKPGKSISFVSGKPTRLLTIPVDAEAHGRRAKEFSGLKVLWGTNGPWALAIAPNEAARRAIGLAKQKEIRAKTNANVKGARLLARTAVNTLNRSVVLAELAIKNETRGDAAKGALNSALDAFRNAHRVLFRLVRSATISPDPTVVPTEEELAKAASEAATRYMMGGAARRAQQQEEGS